MSSDEDLDEVFKAARKKAPKEPKANGHMNGHHHWWAELRMNKEGNPIMNQRNAAKALHGEYFGKFRYNELDCSVEFANTKKPITDADIINILINLQDIGLDRLTKAHVMDAIESAAREFSYHPIKEWLDWLPDWDGVRRLNWLFPMYFGSAPLALEPPEYDAMIGRMFMISMVARIYRPGCQVDHMVVIEGPQGQRKSTACRLLAGDAFFGDSLPDISNKDSSQYLRGKWLIEVAEMHVHSRAETAAMKSFVSRRIERYFARYGRTESNEPRQCVFIGTTNEDEYLKDSTGGRRFWPITAGTIDIAALERDREQLFAEAKTLFEAGEPWWPDAELEREFIKPQQAARLESDLWDDIIGRMLAGKERITAKEIVDQMIALEYIDKNKQGKVEKGRIRDILRRFGWVTKRDNSSRWWIPGQMV